MLLAALSTVTSLTCCRAWGVRRGVDKDASKRTNERFCAAFSFGIEKSIRYMHSRAAWDAHGAVCSRFVVRPGVSKSNQKSECSGSPVVPGNKNFSVLSSKSFC